MRSLKLSPAIVLMSCLTLPSAARAGDRQPMSLHTDYTPKHCWNTFPRAVTAPAMSPKPQIPIASGKSPGLSVLGDGIGPSASDPQLAVSPNYVLVLTTGAYVFYERATHKPLATDGCVPVNANFYQLFAPLLMPEDPVSHARNPAYVNDHLGLGASARFKCDTHDSRGCVNVFNRQVNPDPAVEKDKGIGWYVYDARAYFDRDTQRFWMIAHARNAIFPGCGDVGTNCSPKCKAHQLCDRHDSGCSNCGEDARRFTFVAVSKAEDPRKGFWEYVLVSDAADWPLFAVANDRLLIANKTDAKRVYVFNAKKLLTGTVEFLGKYDDDAFAESQSITLVTQYSDAGGLSLILGSQGNTVWVYGFKDPKKPLLKSHTQLAAAPGWQMQPIYRGNMVYFAADTPDKPGSSDFHIDVHRLRVGLVGSPVRLGALHDQLLPIRRADGASLRVPGVLVETSGAMIVWYLQFPKAAGGRPEARYKVLYDNETDFRDSALLRSSDVPADDSLAGDSQIGGAVDPVKIGFWITENYVDATGTTQQAVGSIDPGCGALTRCGDTCVDLKNDHANCGSCGSVCPKPCAGGVCCWSCANSPLTSGQGR